ncbi:unnamed protein product [Rhizoctonia solani]|uniref:Uncharacterized protein n=1 Tax=Rhizoctonia solani TaxID=456999 RepID=A0A8H2XNF5_9AGAM|nr:unnamed protein product [Rhizoctonia solani]
MHIRNKFQKLNSAIKSAASKSSDISAAPTGTACPPSTKTCFGDWPQFYALRKTLEGRETDGDWLIQTRWVGDFMKYLDQFDGQLVKHHEYGTMLDELATLCEDMKRFYSRDVLPEMTNATRGLYLMVEHELFRLKDKWDNASSETHDIGEHDIDFVITCYREIQNCLRRILLNLIAGENVDTADTVDMVCAWQIDTKNLVIINCLPGT